MIWRAAITAGGVACTLLTFHQYHFSARHSEELAHAKAWSAAEADQKLATAQAYLKEKPDDLDALLQSAIAYYSKGSEFYVESMNSLEKARSLGATDPSLFFYAGVMYDVLGLPDYAINDLQRYLRHDPEDYEAQVRLANLYFRQGNDGEAYALYQRAVKEWPKDPTVLFNYAVVSVKKGDADAAEKALQEVQKLSSPLPLGGIFQQGEIERLRNHDDAAIEKYKQEIAVHPDYIPALEALESAARKKGDLKEARAVHAKIIEARKTAHVQ